MKLSKVKTRLIRNKDKWSDQLRRKVRHDIYFLKGTTVVKGDKPRFFTRHGKEISKVWATTQGKV